MNVLVADIQLLHELERANLTAYVFALPHIFFMADVLYETELADSDGWALLELGLSIAALESNETTSGLIIRRSRPSLCVAGAFGLALAQSRAWHLLSGDRYVLGEARDRAIDCCDLPWLLDELERSGCCPIDALASGLTAMAAGKGCRLPPSDIATRIKKYKRTM